VSFETLIVDVRDGVATVTLNRPEVRNALNQPMIGELESAFSDLEDNSRAGPRPATPASAAARATLSGIRAGIERAMRRGRILLGIAVAAATLTVAGTRPEAGETPLRVVTVAGQAEVYSGTGSAWKAAGLKAELGPGDGARTVAGGRLTLRTPSGQAVRLAPFSRISLLDEGAASDQPTRVKVEGGSVWAAVMPGTPARETLEVAVGALTVTVSGSGVGITLQRDGSVLVRVYHGRATCAGSGRRGWERTLVAEQEMLVSSAGAPGDVRTLTRDKPEPDWVKWNEEQDVAGGYRLEPPAR